MGEAVDTIPSLPNKCHFMSPDRQTREREREKRDAYSILVNTFGL